MNELRNFISENDIPITESKFREMEKLIQKKLEADKAELLASLKRIDKTIKKHYCYDCNGICPFYDNKINCEFSVVDNLIQKMEK
jgi:hypothetical protein